MLGRGESQSESAGLRIFLFGLEIVRHHYLIVPTCTKDIFDVPLCGIIPANSDRALDINHDLAVLDERYPAAMYFGIC